MPPIPSVGEWMATDHPFGKFDSTKRVYWGEKFCNFVFQFGCTRQLSSILRDCSKSFKSVAVEANQMFGCILSLKSFLWKLCMLEDMSAQHWQTFYTMQLKFACSPLLDEGIYTLVGAPLTNSGLSVLDLSYNHNITVRGRHSLADLLQYPNSSAITILVIKGQWFSQMH